MPTIRRLLLTPECTVRDIRGSLAHAAMLARQGIISVDDELAIRGGLLSILEDIEGRTAGF